MNLMIRRTFLEVLASGLLNAPLATEPQQGRKVWRIGLIMVARRKDPGALFQGLRELGYVEGETLAVEPRYSEGRAERFPEFAAELVRLKRAVSVALREGAHGPGSKATASDG